jgi:hypothetical protein
LKGDANGWSPEDQGMINRLPRGISLEAQAGCAVGLWVAVNKEGFPSQRGQGSAKIDGGGRFSDATFLVSYCDDARHLASSWTIQAECIR